MSCDQDAPAAVPAEAVAAAADYWAAQLGTVPEGVNMYRPRRYSGEEAERFRVALGTAISAHLRGDVPILRSHARQEPRHSARDVVEFDYDPDDTLCAAAEAAGIALDWSSLPAKTLMLLRAREVKVREGHGCPFAVIWAAGNGYDAGHGDRAACHGQGPEGRCADAG